MSKITACNRCKKTHSGPQAFLLTCTDCGKVWHHRCHIPPVDDSELIARIQATNDNDVDHGLDGWVCRCKRKGKSKDKRPPPPPNIGSEVLVVERKDSGPIVPLRAEAQPRPPGGVSNQELVERQSGRAPEVSSPKASQPSLLQRGQVSEARRTPRIDLQHVRPQLPKKSPNDKKSPNELNYSASIVHPSGSSSGKTAATQPSSPLSQPKKPGEPARPSTDSSRHAKSVSSQSEGFSRVRFSLNVDQSPKTRVSSIPKTEESASPGLHERKASAVPTSESTAHPRHSSQNEVQMMSPPAPAQIRRAVTQPTPPSHPARPDKRTPPAEDVTAALAPAPVPDDDVDMDDDLYGPLPTSDDERIPPLPPLRSPSPTEDLEPYRLAPAWIRERISAEKRAAATVASLKGKRKAQARRLDSISTEGRAWIGELFSFEVGKWTKGR